MTNAGIWQIDLEKGGKVSEMTNLKQQNPTTIRVLGGILILVGVLLVGSMTAIFVWMNDAMNNSSSTTKFAGTAEQKMITFLILGMVTAFGCGSLMTGIYQVLTGRRNKKLVWLMIGLWVVLTISAWLVQVVF